ncbi:MobA/MobL family protein [Eubacterium sp.]|uniref:MobA/MobL family protein n=1 Tax=Eubacterium sp. TaxID=142586 RepID=UPI00258880AD|nr:MobA/MobL family protein [Eubacterium sp.]
MAIKNISTRMKICGRGSKCSGGHSAVEQSGYICREKMYSEYDGQTYYPKYAEDLVHSEVLLPENAPPEYKNPAKLWNSVEMAEKGKSAQLARTWRIELPNEWTYEYATMFVRNFCEKHFVSKGMCVQFAIHDTENNKGQRNLHCHIMLTLRSLDEQGEWMPKQKKIYLTDENGERIPVIDKKTGQQKVDKQNRKQWKCTTDKTNDWDDQKYSKLWRRELADAINAANAELGMTENFWEYRSFKEQGLDIEPQIHLGEKASAMERVGILTIRGNINREIIARNAIINAARIAMEKAKAELEAVKAIPVAAVKEFKSEILDMIQKMCERNKNRLSLPIISGKFLAKISNRSVLQDKAFMEKYVESRGWSTFAEMQADKEAWQEQYDNLETRRNNMTERMSYLEGLLDFHNEKYEPYHKINSEYWKLKKVEEKNGKPLGFFKKSQAEEYRKQHQSELNTYKVYRDVLKNMIEEPDKKITPKGWQKELDSLTQEYQKTEKPLADAVINLAKVEVLNHNKRDLERMLNNERHIPARTITRKRNEPSL